MLAWAEGLVRASLFRSDDQRACRQGLTVIVDCQAAVQALVDLDPCLRVAAPAGTRQDLQVMRSDGERVVVGDGGEVLEGEDGIGIEGIGPEAIGGLGLGRRLGEARVVALEEAREEGVGVFAGGDVREAQFGHEAILEGAALPLDAPFGLRRRSGDPLDAEFLQGAADLGGRGAAAELLVDREGSLMERLPLEDAVAIRVHGEGEARGVGDVAEEQEIALGVLVLAEDRPEHRPRGVVDGMEESQPRPAVLEPGVVAAVHLHEHAGLREAHPPPAMLGPSAGAWAAQALRREDAVDRRPRQDEAFPLGEEFTEVLEVHPGIGGPGEMDHPRPGGVRHPTR